MSGPVEIAEEAWGSPLPDWVRVLAHECARSNQTLVAKRLGRSGAVVSQVLHNRYGARTTLIEERVRGLYMHGAVACPGIGGAALPTNECQDWREKAGRFEMGDPNRTRMYRDCHACPRYQKDPEE